MRLLIGVLLAANISFAANRFEIDISPAQVWTDTGIDLRAGDSVTISATGSIQLDPSRATGPEGLARTWSDLTSSYPVANAGRGALIARFSASPAARAFWVGPYLQRSAPVSGRLFLGINETDKQGGAGGFHVVVEWSQALYPTPAYYPVFPQQMLDDLPPQVVGPDGGPRERVNFIVVGTEQRLLAALSDAGWIPAARNKKQAVWHGIMASLSKEGDIATPVAPRELFGHLPDFAFQQADSVKAVASHHELRLWQTPYTLYGKPVWAGQGARDGVQGKSDQTPDSERDYIGQSIETTGYSVKQDYMLPAYAVQREKGFVSDGRTLVIFLQP